jgi:hypothetical protein
LPYGAQRFLEIARALEPHSSNKVAFSSRWFYQAECTAYAHCG